MVDVFRSAKFMLSVFDEAALPADSGAEVAFIGYSNVGKSTALNALTGQRRLAHTSKTPGRTQALNFFDIDGTGERRLVDLPGYGFAKAPAGERERWLRLVEGYLAKRQSLMGLLWLMDIRNLLRPFDLALQQWITETGLPTVVLLTKADKLGAAGAQRAVGIVQESLAGNKNVDIVLFSAKRQQGIVAVVKQIERWLSPTEDDR